ncbi:MAG TPA: 2Fe-2S iron-sulfur cluster-binding protein [Pirellulales bacterium]|nr:2Fe-2S iron-sulfur cluster-binding protein [Pirellulales bacterium]
MKDERSSRAGASGVSRRAFLQGSGAAAAATALATGGGVAAAADDKAKVLGPGPTTIKLKVNGADRQVTVEPRTTLLEALRYKLNLTGAKPVSVDDSSGASMVIIDGKPASANTVLAVACVGKKIQTVESLGGNKPDAVPTAFVHNDGMQCGFCTPGFVVAVRAFLDKNPKATEQQIRKGLNSNLCRCGTYANVIMAAMEVVKGGARG